MTAVRAQPNTELTDLDLGDGYVMRAATLRPAITDEAVFREVHAHDPAHEAVIALAQERLEDAAREVSQLLAAEPDSVRYRTLWAHVLRDTGRLDEAEALLTELIAASTGGPRRTLQGHLAKVYFTAGHYAEAADLFGQVLEERRRSGAGPDALATSALGLARAREELERSR